MKRRIMGILLTCAMCCTLFSAPVLAAETGGSGPNVSDVASEQLDETLRAVSDYLNDQAVSLNHFDEKVYNVPVGDEFVTVTRTTEQVQRSRGFGRDTLYDVVANRSYVSSITIDAGSFGGKIWMKIYFDTGNAIGNRYSLRIVSATFVVNWSDFDITNAATAIERSYDNTTHGEVGGFCDMRSPTTGVTQELLARAVMDSHSGNKIIVDYTYGFAAK